MPGTLYIVGTPIGNLGDLSPRAKETLASVDFIAAEDTRVTLKLLNHFDIKKPMTSYFEHNRREKGEQILARLQSGMDSDGNLLEISPIDFSKPLIKQMDALKTVADGVNALRSPSKSAIVITHYKRLLEMVTPDRVHVLRDGRIVAEGGFELVEQIDNQGYDSIR